MRWLGLLLGSFLLFLERVGVRHAEERIIQRHLLT
jgi:hypothetical protein